MGFEKLSPDFCQINGLKVVDTSFVDSCSFFRSDTIHEAVGLFEQLSHSYLWIDRFIDESVSFPEEVVSEFSQGSIKLRRHAKQTQKRYREDFMSRPRKDELCILSRSLFNAVHARKRFMRRVMLKHLTETRLECEWEKYFPAVSEIAVRPGIKIDYGARHGASLSSGMNKDHDERIFAKAFALSFRKPVYLLTGDSDFQRMHKAFYENLELLAECHQFSPPDYPVLVILDYSHGLEILEPFEELKPFTGWTGNIPLYLPQRS